MATSTPEREMDIGRYCETIYRELSQMKKKTFEIVCGVETSTAEEEVRRAEYFDLFDLVDYLEEKLESLTRKCPPDWRQARAEIERGRRKLGDAIDWWYG